MSMRTLKDLVVVVTGASSGIGAGIARHFGAEQARLVVCARNEQRLRALADSLGLPEGRCVTIAADVRTASGMKKIVSAAMTGFGRIDIFVNNAGVGVSKPVHELTEQEYDQIMETNVKAVFLSFRELIPIMRAQGGGQIINISSGAARIGVPGMAAYAASKAALNTLSESAAGEVRNDNIKISVLAPASTDTSFGSNMAGKPATTASRASQKLTVDEVAEAVLFLARQNSNAWTSLADIRPLAIRK